MLKWNSTGTPTRLLILFIGVLTVACVRNPPLAQPDNPTQPSDTETAASSKPTTPPTPTTLPERLPELPTIVEEDLFLTRTLEELNRESPLEPAFFEYDSSELNEISRGILETSANILNRYQNWVVTIEGHCDERGTPEYNLGLGERRALAARNYLVELGLEQNRLRTVSYGKEFPFDPNHDESAWASNRRAHFVITAK